MFTTILTLITWVDGVESIHTEVTPNVSTCAQYAQDIFEKGTGGNQDFVVSCKVEGPKGVATLEFKWFTSKPV